MGKLKPLFTWALVASLAALSVAAASATRKGTSVMHYMTRTPLSATDVEPNVSGSVRLQFNEQGRSSLQKFDLSATGLEPGAEYFLVVARGDDTNLVGIVTSDTHGRVRLSYMKKGNGRGNPRKALPPELDPVSEILGLGLQETVNTQTVAFAWIATSPSFQYLVKRNLTSTDTSAPPAGSISLKANPQNVNFRLLADGLTGGNTYHLALNSNVVASATANADGTLEVNAWPASAPAVLELRSLSLWDDSSNVVLGTSLPK
jgi:hypothetical protein